MRVLCRVIDLEPAVDNEGKPVCHVTLKLSGEQRQRSTVVVTLKEKHLLAGVNNDLEAYLGKPLLLNICFMLSDRKEIVWFFPPEDRDGVRPVLYQPQGLVSVGGKSVDSATGEVLSDPNPKLEEKKEQKTPLPFKSAISS